MILSNATSSLEAVSFFFLIVINVKKVILCFVTPGLKGVFYEILSS